MGRKPLNNPQTYDEMVSYNEETKASSKLYKATPNLSTASFPK